MRLKSKFRDNQSITLGQDRIGKYVRKEGEQKTRCEMPETKRKNNQADLLGVYQYLSRELQQAKDALMMELRMTSAQIGSLHGELKDAHDKSATTVAQEIRFSYKQNQTIYDGLASMLTKEVGERLNSIEEILAELSKLQLIIDSLEELKNGYVNLQAVCDTTQALVVNEVNPKLDSIGSVLTGDVTPKLDAITNYLATDLNPKVDDIQAKQALLDEIQALATEINNKLVYLPTEDDYTRLVEAVAAKTEETATTYSRQVVDAIAALPTAENVDYSRIVEEVGDKLLDILHQIKGEDPAPVLPVETKIDYDRIICGAAEKVVESLPYPEKVDYSRLEQALAIDADALAETVASKIAIPEAPVPEVLNYNLISDMVAEKVRVPEVTVPTLEINYDLLSEMVAEKVTIPVAPAAEINYDALSDMVAGKVAVPAAPEVDYDNIATMVAGRIAIPAPAPEVDYERIADMVAGRIAMPAPEVDYERLADMVAARIAVPAAPQVNYDLLADIVIEKLAASSEQTCEILLDEEGIDEIATKLAGKIIPSESIDYDKVCQAAQAAQILPDPVDYDRIAEIMEDKLGSDEPDYDLIIDEEGLSALAKGVSNELCQMCAFCELATEEVCEEEVCCEEPVEEVVATEEPIEEVAEEEPAEEPVEETVEEAVEEPTETAVEEEIVVAEEPAEEPVEEVVGETTVEEVPVEEIADETPVEDAPVEETEEPATETVESELATAEVTYQEVGNELVDAETGLVIRLKRSFTAKMRQSEEKVKGYYSDLKNELTSYKKINSNVSWHGDRFNFGRDTVAKINICGKTLCFYVALDPNDPEFKSTVYHQKDVGEQKAYESTPFMVKVKSDAAAKKALRLVGYLAEKLGTEKEESFEAVDYAGEFAYASTKQLFDEGFIKATKEKKVDLNF